MLGLALGGGNGDRQKRGQRRIELGRGLPADHQAALRGRPVQRTKHHLGRELARLRRAYEGRADSRANQTDTVGARPDLLGDVRGDAGLGKGRQYAVVKPRIVGAREEHKGGGRQVAQVKRGLGGERVIGGQEHAVFLAQE